MAGSEQVFASQANYDRVLKKIRARIDLRVQPVYSPDEALFVDVLELLTALTTPLKQETMFVTTDDAGGVVIDFQLMLSNLTLSPSDATQLAQSLLKQASIAASQATVN